MFIFVGKCYIFRGKKPMHYSGRSIFLYSITEQYFSFSDPKDSPKIHPYPNWDWHKLNGQPLRIVSPFRIRADSCDRLWVLDSGYTNILGGKTGSKPQLLIFDLKTDQLIKNYTIPDDQYVTGRNLFCNVVVEENNCTDSFAYLSDLSNPGLVVYSFENHRSWLVTHNFFALDPLAGNMTVAGVSIVSCLNNL